jgi:recombination protein RecA
MAVKLSGKEEAVVAKDAGHNLEELIAAVRKDKGDKVIVKGNQIPDVTRVPTGVFEFDLATGGGFPCGRYSIVYGVESSGKTNLCLKAIAYVQKNFPAGKNKCVFVDLEHTFDPKWAEQMGVDTSLLEVVQPAYGEECVDVVDALLRADDLAFICVDSIAVMVSIKEVQKSVESADVGTSSLLMKRLCNKIVLALGEQSRKGCFPCVVLLNQRRFKIGVMFGDPETMPGGETVKFLSSLTVRLYGKNVIEKAIHPDLPAYKHTSIIIKKSKVPITSVNFEYQMAMIPADVLSVGETDSWNVVSGHLKAMGTLAKNGAEWEIQLPGLGPFQEGAKAFKTLGEVREMYLGDSSFAAHCQAVVTAELSKNKFTVES